MQPQSTTPSLPAAGWGRWAIRGDFEIRASVEQVALAASIFWTLACNRAFFAAALHDAAPADPPNWMLAAALGAIILALHFALLLVALNRWTFKPVLAALIIVTAFATFYVEQYGVYLDPPMIRNVLHTNIAEGRELFSWALVPHLALCAVAPLAVLHRVRIVRRPPLRAVLVRLLAVSIALMVVAGAAFAAFQPLASMMRNHRELRYMVTPANWMWSAASALVQETHGATRVRQPIGLDASPGVSWQRQARPRLLVLVVGETARSANWGLNRYARQTTPQLARLPVVNFPDVTACGTSTEVSLPCMFSAQGRRHYDEQAIRFSESLLHLLARAGAGVHWLDNQGGCKGVCDGLPQASTTALDVADLCRDGQCFDEALLSGLDRRLDAVSGVQVLVLHMLGNHGPAYFRRYPPAFARFSPACEDDDLRKCTQEQIVNAYDNALLYTDHVLAQLIARLQARTDKLDAAMVYVSDHGESLGENRLFLHGIPYRIAPVEQTKVPMVLWASDGFARTAGVDMACLRQRETHSFSHDNLFHTVLGLLDVHTSLYDRDLDIAADCRASNTHRS